MKTEGYRVHRDGYIQARTIEVDIPPHLIWRAMHVGPTRQSGIEREIAEHLGIEIEGTLRVRVTGHGTVILESDWVRPSRS